jgi:hypothetical protein
MAEFFGNSNGRQGILRAAPRTDKESAIRENPIFLDLFTIFTVTLIDCSFVFRLFLNEIRLNCVFSGDWFRAVSGTNFLFFFG